MEEVTGYLEVPLPSAALLPCCPTTPMLPHRNAALLFVPAVWLLCACCVPAVRLLWRALFACLRPAVPPRNCCEGT